MKLYAFDVDHTLAISDGPIGIHRLVKLAADGHIVGICGNWAVLIYNFPERWKDFINFIGPIGVTKGEFLAQLKKYIPADEYILVGNIGGPGRSDDKNAAIESGFQFIKEDEFEDTLQMVSHVTPEYSREYYKKNKDRIKKRVAVWRLANPSTVQSYRLRWQRSNPDKMKQYREKYLAKQGPEYSRVQQLKHLYGISLEQYDKMRTDQKFKCAICGLAESLARKGRLFVDHDHVTGKIRGLLCDDCNNGIARLKESVKILMFAQAYLERQ